MTTKTTNGTGSPLTVHNAAVHTAAVSINTLTIKGKQVTLAVFDSSDTAN
jgi:hypothetical protein